MPVNDIISVPDYNNIRTAIADVMGTGSGTYGYGQQLQSSPVSVGTSVTKTQWDNLRFDIINAIVHQTSSLPTISIPNAGELIRYAANVPNYQYLTLANQARTNRFDIGSGQYATEAGLNSGNLSVSFIAFVQNSFTVSWPSAEAARYFFNAGGKIRFSSTFTKGASSNTQDQSWVDLLTAAGTAVFGGNSPTINFFNLTSSDQDFFTYYGSSPYSSNKWILKARCNVSNNSSGTATSITFTSRWQDDYTDPTAGDPGNPPPGDGVTGTLTLTVNHIRPVGTLYPALVANSFSTTPPTYGPLSAVSFG